LDVLPHQKVPKTGKGDLAADYVLSGPIPKAVLDGTMSKEQARPFVVEDLPDIVLPTDKQVN
jgi:hypothetical protein